MMKYKPCSQTGKTKSLYSIWNKHISTLLTWRELFKAREKQDSHAYLIKHPMDSKVFSD